MVSYDVSAGVLAVVIRLIQVFCKKSPLRLAEDNGVATKGLCSGAPPYRLTTVEGYAMSDLALTQEAQCETWLLICLSKYCSTCLLENAESGEFGGLGGYVDVTDAAFGRQEVLSSNR